MSLKLKLKMNFRCIFLLACVNASLEKVKTPVFKTNFMYAIFLATSFTFVYISVTLGLCFYPWTAKIKQNADSYVYTHVSLYVTKDTPIPAVSGTLS